jgi:hypothetical protein
VPETHKEATDGGLLRELPQEFVVATMFALSEMTVGFLQRQPKQAAMYRDTGFEMLWAALVRKK